MRVPCPRHAHIPLIVVRPRPPPPSTICCIVKRLVLTPASLFIVKRLVLIPASLFLPQPRVSSTTQGTGNLSHHPGAPQPRCVQRRVGRRRMRRRGEEEAIGVCPPGRSRGKTEATRSGGSVQRPERRARGTPGEWTLPRESRGRALERISVTLWCTPAGPGKGHRRTAWRWRGCSRQPS